MAEEENFTSPSELNSFNEMLLREGSSRQRQKVVCRLGTSEDVVPVQSVCMPEVSTSGCHSNLSYSERDFERDFLLPNDLDEERDFSSDPRQEITTCRIASDRYLVIALMLPEMEDERTFDIDVNSERVLFFSHKFKAKHQFPRRINATETHIKWDAGDRKIRITILSHKS